MLHGVASASDLGVRKHHIKCTHTESEGSSELEPQNFQTHVLKHQEQMYGLAVQTEEHKVQHQDLMNMLHALAGNN